MNIVKARFPALNRIQFNKIRYFNLNSRINARLLKLGRRAFIM